ncbi:hypothetical protein DL764_004924 [Monosporascus ibericus]|uniref:Uncharacterized protein n=1 Tax=Monosporascus ibericus TaxID=155417 RepID=A0A4V1XAS3_9PEZI|nr:hypothetical protein DL764_004924 [Monosporascus ibericus]
MITPDMFNEEGHLISRDVLPPSILNTILDPYVEIDIDCVCASALPADEKEAVYDKLKAPILNNMRGVGVPKRADLFLVATEICERTKATKHINPNFQTDRLVTAVLKLMIYEVSKDIQESRKKAENIVGSAYELIHGNLDPFAGPIFTKGMMKGYRFFHTVLLRLDSKDRLLTKSTKVAAAYLAVKLYFDNPERTKAHFDVLWIAAQWLINASEELVMHKKAEVITEWPAWRDQIQRQMDEFKENRKPGARPSEIEFALAAAHRKMMDALLAIDFERRRINAYQDHTLTVKPRPQQTKGESSKGKPSKGVSTKGES